MELHVARWGNSLAMRLPSEVVRQLLACAEAAGAGELATLDKGQAEAARQMKIKPLDFGK